MAHSPTPLPTGWKTAPLNCIAKMVSGGTPSKSNPKFWHGDIPWLSAKDLKSFRLSSALDNVTKLGMENGTRLVPENSILILVRGMTLLKDVPLGLTTRPVTFNQDLKALSVFDGTNPAYLAYWLVSHRNNLMNLVDRAGHGTGRLTTEQLEAVSVLLPPLEEQARIVEILDEADAAVCAADALINAKIRCKNAVAERLLEGVGKNWRKVKIGDIITESRISANRSTAQKRLTVRLYTEGVETRTRQNVEAEGATAYYVRRAGQLIYGKQNLHKGAVGIVPPELDGWTSSQDLPAFDWQPGFAPEFFLRILSRKQFYENLERLATGTGSKRIHPETLYKINIYVPDETEQREIAETLSLMDEEIRLLKRQRDAQYRLKQALMQQLLTGQLRTKETAP